MEAPGLSAPLSSRAFTAFLLVLLAFTFVLAVLAFPAGLYAVFGGGLSTSLSYGSIVQTYLWIGPLPLFLPFEVQIGGLFVLLSVVYISMLALEIFQRERPLGAARNAFKSGVGSLLESPLFVTLVSIGFINFSSIVVIAVSETALGSIRNPFSNVDPLLEFGSLTFAPLREEIGFRVVLIGLVAFILSIGRPPREALKALWRPSVLFEGWSVGRVSEVILWIAMGFSAITFGVVHANGYGWGKVPEAVWAGIVLGYLYIRYGFHVAVLVHWGVDYLGNAYAYFGQSAFGVPANSVTTEYLGQYLVDFDMLFLLGLVSFVLVVYLVVRRIAQGQRTGAGEFDKGPPPRVGVKP